MPSKPRTLIFLLTILLTVPMMPVQAGEWLVPGDLNHDQITNHLDFFQLLNDYDPAGRRLSPEADLNSDLRVNHQDIHWALSGRRFGRNSIQPPDPEQTGKLVGVVREDVGMLEVHIPISGAEVYLSSGQGLRRMTTTGPDGSFRFDFVPAGETRLVAKHPDYHQTRLSVEVRVGEETSCIIEMPPRKPDLADLSGYVRGSAGDATIPPIPIKGAVVRIVPLNGEIPTGDFDYGHHPGTEDAHQVTTTDEQGHYVFHDLPTGRFRLVVSARGYQSEEREIGIEDPNVDLFEDFLLLPISEGYGKLAGTIFSHDPRSMRPMDIPLPGATIILESIWSQPQPFDLNHPPDRIHQTISDASGNYSFERIPPGEYVGHVWAGGHEPATAEITILVHETTRQDFHLEVILISRGAVAGQVTGTTPGGAPLPIEDAVVALLKQPEPNITPRFPSADLISAARIRSVTTDSEGHYAFTEVPEGDYLLIAWARGWGQVTGAATVIGETTSEVNLQFVKNPPPPPASLRGIVYGAPHSTDPANLPIPISGAFVVAFPAKNELMDDLPLLPPWPKDVAPPQLSRFTDLTNEKGEYSIADLPPGAYRLVAMARGFHPQEKGIELPPGVEMTQDFILIPKPSGPGMVLGMVFSEGNPDGSVSPVAGARVRLSSREIPGGPDLLGNFGQFLPPIDIPLFETTTNGEGYFEFSPVPIGSYVLTVSANGFRPEMLEVEVHPGQTVRLSIRLVPVPPDRFGSLSGHVWEYQDPNIDSIPRSISGAVVVAVPFSFNILPLGGSSPVSKNHPPDPGEGPLPFVAKTDQSGFYRFEQLPIGKVVVLVLAKDYLPGLKQAEVLADQNNTLDFYLRPIGQQPTRSKLYGVLMENSPYPTFAPVYVGGAEISLYPIRPAVGPLDNKDTSDSHRLTTYSDDQGRYEFNEIPAGSYRVVIRARGYHPHEAKATLPPGGEVRMDFGLDPILPVETGDLYGHVYETGNIGIQHPLENALVRLIPEGVVIMQVYPPPDINLDRVTDENGAYRFEDIPAQGYMVVVMKEGFQTFQGQVTIPNQGSVEEDWYLERNPGPQVSTVFGVVREATSNLNRVGAPIAHAQLRLELLLPPGPNPEKIVPSIWETTSNANGAYRFQNLPSGAFRIRVSKDGYEVIERIFELAPEDNHREDFFLIGSPSHGTLFHGYVSEDVGMLDVWIAIGGATLTLDNPLIEQPARTTQTKPDGSYAFEGVPPGDYEIHIEAEGYEPHQQPIKIPGGPEFLQSFLLKKHSTEPKGMIEGSIRFIQPNGDTLPAPGVPVFLGPSEVSFNPGNTRMTLTNLEGKYRFKELPPGTYLLKIQVPGREPIQETVEVNAEETSQVDFSIPLSPGKP